MSELAPFFTAQEIPATEMGEDAAAPKRTEQRLRLIDEVARLPDSVLTLLTVTAIIALWYLTSALAIVPELFLPSPAAVLRKLHSVATEGFADATLLQHAATSIGRVFTALIFALATAAPIGILIGLNRRIRAVVDPLIEFYRPLPPLAYLPLIVIWCGIGELSKVLLIYLAIFAPISIATVQGVRRVDESRIGPRSRSAPAAGNWCAS